MADNTNTPVMPSYVPPAEPPASDPVIIPPTIAPPPGQVPPGSVNNEPKQTKKTGGKTGTIIGGLFLLIVLPVVGYYVSQKTNIMNNLPFAECHGPQCETVTVWDGRAWKDKSVRIREPGGGDKCDGPKSCPAGQQLRCSYGGGGGAFNMGKCTCSCSGTAHSPTPIPPTNTPIPPTNTPIPPTNTPIPPTNPPSQPGPCDASCGSDSDCDGGRICATVQGVKRCRNSSCTGESTCNCPAAPATPTPTSGQIVQRIIVTATPAQEIVQVVTATPTPKIPVAGTPAILGAATVGGGILLLILGLLL